MKPKIIFRDINPDVAIAVRDAFQDVPEFNVDCGDIFSAGAADAIVSPANSHGWMDGGIDAVYLRVFGEWLQDALRAHLARAWPDGVMPVGRACAIQTLHPDIPWMISAPTMETPGSVRDTQNAYLAFRAVLNISGKQNFNTILCPGLATLTGRMAPAESATQMRQAWDEILGA